MLLNSKFSNFDFRFPKGFFFPEIEERYDIFFKRQPIPYTNLTDYVNYTVQSVSWPAVTTDTTEQLFKDAIKTYKGGFEAPRYFDRTFDVTFRTTEGYLNYWIMHDQFFKYWEWGPEHEMFLPDFNLKILDHSGYLVMTMIFKDVVFSGLSELELSYANNVPEYKSFNATFKFKIIDLKKELS